MTLLTTVSLAVGSSPTPLATRAIGTRWQTLKNSFLRTTRFSGHASLRSEGRRCFFKRPGNLMGKQRSHNAQAELSTQIRTWSHRTHPLEICCPARCQHLAMVEAFFNTAFAGERRNVPKRLNTVNTPYVDKHGASHATKAIEQIMESNSIVTLYISRSAQQSGYGSDRYKTVTFLTADERAQVKSGEQIFFRATRVSAKGTNGTYWRVAKVCGAAIGPRVPSLEKIAALRAKTGEI